MARVGRTNGARGNGGGALIAGLGVLISACGARPACDGIACAPACPRDAARDRSGRCACTAGDVLVLGACVPPAVGDAYCGPAARVGVDGCAFRACADGELLDAATGACLPKTRFAPATTVDCGEGATPVVSLGRIACVDADALCPRGTRHSGAACPRPQRCPPGTLAVDGECRSVVTVGVHGDAPRVDVGAWAGLVFGADGGPGTPDLCRPLSLRPDAFGLPPGSAAVLTVHIAVAAPDQDLARLYARAHTDLNMSEFLGSRPSRPLSAEAEAVVAASVGTLIEALRGLGGEASAAMVELRVSCRVNSL